MRKRNLVFFDYFDANCDQISHEISEKQYLVKLYSDEDFVSDVNLCQAAAFQ